MNIAKPAQKLIALKNTVTITLLHCMRLLQKARLQTKINPRTSDIAGKN